MKNEKNKKRDIGANGHIRAAIYTRVSTDEQAEHGYSLDEQIAVCESEIKRHDDWETIGVYADPGESGTKMDRPGLNRLIKDIEDEKIDAVVVWKLDRLSRKQRMTLEIIEDVLIENGVNLVSTKETLDTSTPWGMAMIGILASFNQMELENIKMRTALGRKAKAELGGFAGGRPPFGYRMENHELVIREYEAEIVRRIFKMFSDGMTYRDICDKLNNEEGLSTRVGAIFRPNTLTRIKNNEDLYRGNVTVGDGTDRKLVPGRHQAILKD